MRIDLPAQFRESLENVHGELSVSTVPDDWWTPNVL
jgi:hypothetical protein